MPSSSCSYEQKRGSEEQKGGGEEQKRGSEEVFAGIKNGNKKIKKKRENEKSK